MYVSVTPEVAIEGLTKFAGGLGVLEGDKLIEAKSIGIDYAVITMYHPGGYASYEVSNGDLAEVSDDWVVSNGRNLGSFTIKVRGEEITLDSVI
ncbi:MAG: glycosyl transferase family 1, partial [Zestosphaera sp.]